MMSDERTIEERYDAAREAVADCHEVISELRGFLDELSDMHEALAKEVVELTGRAYFNQDSLTAKLNRALAEIRMRTIANQRLREENIELCAEIERLKLGHQTTSCFLRDDVIAHGNMRREIDDITAQLNRALDALTYANRWCLGDAGTCRVCDVLRENGRLGGEPDEAGP